MLRAYSKYDKQLGYVQGMNFIAGALLYHCSETIAFWLFVSLMEDYNMRDIYMPEFPGLHKHILVINSLFAENFKELMKHLVYLNNITSAIKK